jgi:hypothetical protein
LAILDDGVYAAIYRPADGEVYLHRRAIFVLGANKNAIQLPPTYLHIQPISDWFNILK